MALRHTARAIVLYDDKLLLMERWRLGKYYFSIPGGAIEPGEAPEQTVVREIAEETGCTITPIRLLYNLTFSDGTNHQFFLCDYVSGEPHLPADAPEAVRHDDNNRYHPGWVPIEVLHTAPFLVWAPVIPRLLHDIEHGFPETPQTLA